ncbi:MAG: SHOCT domain-containing protein [Acidimicrobiia bacterium]|nr:SHOCT domain-containing protein [Acidimicrobiia bacterium]
MMWGYGGYGVFWMLLFWVGVAFLIAWAVRGREESNQEHRAIAILEERFARGELEEDEYQARRAQLSS